MHEKRRGMLGPHTADEFDAAAGYEPPVRRSEIRTFTHDDASAVLDGDDPRQVRTIRSEIRAAIRRGDPYTIPHGGHRYGSGWGKNEFDPGWDESDVVDYVFALMDNPVRITESDFGFKVYGVFRGVPGVVVVNSDGSGTRGWHIVSVYPVVV